MLKTIGLLDVSRPELENNDDKVNGFGVVGGGEELTKKSGKSKGQNLSKSQKLAKSGKYLLKSRNSSNFGTIDGGPSFLTPSARETFNHLWLAFNKTPIFWHFDPECHIWIETDASSYVISDVLSLLAFGTRSDGVVTKTDLG